jgi:predicted O-methyltransferase YrrM
LRERYRHVPLAIGYRKKSVTKALMIKPDAVAVIPSEEMKKIIDKSVALGDTAHRDLFYLDNKPLPCVLNSDYKDHDGWLTASNNYPQYFALYRALLASNDNPRMVEIGVRTGYQAVVFARACQQKTSLFYMGVDPNLYVKDGLYLASETLKRLRDIYPSFNFTLIEGYSWEQVVQRCIHYSGPFHIVHIDGDHSLEGKLIDLELARNLLAHDGVVLVDDYDHHPQIKDAIKISMKSGWYREFAYIPTLRGLAVIK